MDKFIKVGSREYERKTNTAAIRGTTVSGPLVGAGVPLIVVGVIYLIGAPRDLEEARYHSVLFLANSIGALTATIGICRSHKWDWKVGLKLGGLGRGRDFVGYVISRTVGLPGLPAVEEWLEPLGLLSLLVESLFVRLWLMTFAPIPSREGDKNSPS